MAKREKSRRQQRVGEHIRRVLAEELLDGDGGQSITVTEVQASPDLRNATVYFLPLGGGSTEDALGVLERRRGELQRAVSLKYAPRLRFVRDDLFDQSDRLQALMKASSQQVEGECDGDGELDRRGE